MSAPVALGVDVGGTKVLGVVTDATGRVLAEERRPTPRSGAEDLTRAIHDVVASLGARGDLADLPVGVGLPGLVDLGGVLRFSPHLAAAVGLDLRRTWPAAWASPHVLNDAAGAAGAEREWGAARDLDDALFVALGTGIGGALIRHGGLEAGPRGFAGEYGHMTIVPRGEACPCGGRGCWERYASADGLVRFEREAGGSGDGGGPGVVARARRGEPAATAALEQFVTWLALGLANLVAALDVATVIIGGGMAREADLFLSATEAGLAGSTEGSVARPATRLRPAATGEHAGALGAALAAWRSA